MRKSQIATAVAFLIATAFAANAQSIPFPGTGAGQGEANRTLERAGAKVPLNIPQQRLETALQELAQKTDLQIICRTETVGDLRTPGISGEMTRDEALKKLLDGANLTYHYLDNNTVSIQPAATAKTTSLTLNEGNAGDEPLRVAQNTGNSPSSGTGEGRGEDAKEQTAGENQDEEDSERAGIPEILVTGSKLGTLNMDIARTVNDVQPYIVYTRDIIENSGSLSVDEFLRNQLTVSTAAAAISTTSMGNRSSINLRGLGSDETLILVDGRRVAQFLGDLGPEQPNINGIPLSAIERIEVLPTTAAGIYGGSATGGVINIVLRRDYSGIETKLTYGNTFSNDAVARQIDMNGGFSLEGGKTSLVFAGSYANADPLLNHDREFVQKGRKHIMANDPSYFLDSFLPPIGATPNICSGSGFCDGAPLILDNGVSLGSSIAFVPAGYPGVGADISQALAATAGRFNLEMPDSAQSDGRRQAISAVPETSSLMLTVRREFTSSFRAFLDLQTSKTLSKYPSFGFLNATIPADAPNNPFQQAITVAMPAVGLDGHARADFETLQSTLGIIGKLPHDWHVAVDFSWSKSKSSRSTPPNISPTSAAAISSGSIDVLRDLNQFPVEFERNPDPASGVDPANAQLRSTAMRVAGPLPWQLPAGEITLSTLVEYRNESFSDSVFFSGASRFLTPGRDQTVKSIYAETKLPLFTARNRVRGAELLELQVALRRDEYSVTGSNGFISLANPTPVERRTNRHTSIDPTIGLRYQPIRDLTIRGSYGTGFRPPSVFEIVPNAPIDELLSYLFDPRRGNQPLGNVTVRAGGNPTLKPESSESWSAGLIFTPQSVSGLRISSDYTHISKADVIGSHPGFQQGLINDEIFFPDRVERAPNLPGDPIGWAGPIRSIDATLLNVAKLEVEAIDIAASYETDLERFGAVDFSLRATQLLSAEIQTAPSASVVEYAKTFASFNGAGGPRWTANAALNWSYHGWSAGWRCRFFDSYFLNTDHTVNPRQGEAAVSSQIYHDVFSGYRFTAEHGSLLSGVEIRVGITNVFDKEPPIDVVKFSGAYYSPLGDPRLASYYVSLRKSFGIE